MTKSEVMALLKENKNERGIANWKKVGSNELKSFGIGLTQLRKLGKKVGRHHGLGRSASVGNEDGRQQRVEPHRRGLPRQLRRRLHQPDDVDDLELPLLGLHDRFLAGDHQHRHAAELGVGGRGPE